MGIELIKAKEITKFFGDKSIINKVSLSVKEGDFLYIKGPSGSGKSSLLYILSTLDNEFIGDLDLKVSNSTFRTEFFGYVLQEHYLIDYLNVKENILLPLKMLNKDSKHIENKYIEVMKFFDLSDIENKYPQSLSTGEKQRVSFLRSIIVEPEILFCDEPTSSLDGENSTILLDLLKRYQKNGGTVVVVSHDEEISKYAENSFKLHKKVSPNSLVETPRRSSVFDELKTPYFTTLNMAWKQMVKNKVKSLMILLSVFISILSLSFAFNLNYSFSKDIESSIEKEIDQNEVIVHNSSYRNDVGLSMFTKNQLERIELYEPSVVLPIYDFTLRIEGYDTFDVTFLDQYNSDRVLNHLLIEGRMPNEANELLISKDYFDTIKTQGREILLNENYSSFTQYKDQFDDDVYYDSNLYKTDIVIVGIVDNVDKNEVFQIQEMSETYRLHYGIPQDEYGKVKLVFNEGNQKALEDYVTTNDFDYYSYQKYYENARDEYIYLYYSLMLISALLIVVVTLMLSSVFYVSNFTRIDEIAILKIYGFTKTSTGILLLNEGIIYVGVSAILTLILSIVVQLVTANVSNDVLPFNTVYFDVLGFVYIIAAMTLFLSSIIYASTTSVRKSDPMKIIRK